MSCSRQDCDSIMCDTYIDSIGYICKECQAEFKEYLAKKDIKVTTEGEIREALYSFMKTFKNEYSKENELDVDEFFRLMTD